MSFLSRLNIISLFSRTPRQLLLDQQTSALMDVIEHQKAAEYHTAMVSMLRKRIERIQRTIDTEPIAAPRFPFSDSTSAGV